MWFKQTTCDCCYKPLATTGRHNRYYFCRILEFEELTPFEFKMNYNKYNNRMEFRINYDTSQYCPNGKVYCYKTEPLQPNSFSTWFCSKECAMKEAKRLNVVLFYYDEYEHSVAFFTPHSVEINRAIGEYDDTPLLMMAWGEDNWFQQRSDFRDLSAFGFETDYPVFSLKNCNVIKPNTETLEEYKKLALDDDFEKDFWGTNSEDLKQEVKAKFPRLLKSVDIDFGRRLMVEWAITSKQNCYMGFIHLTLMSPAFPYKCVMEFGLCKQYRRKGIMTSVINTVAKWAKDNGCDKIYAISEDHNIAAHNLLANLPYNVESKRVYMSDKFGGSRPMMNFIISLES